MFSCDMTGWLHDIGSVLHSSWTWLNDILKRYHAMRSKRRSKPNFIQQGPNSMPHQTNGIQPSSCVAWPGHLKFWKHCGVRLFAYPACCCCCCFSCTCCTGTFCGLTGCLGFGCSAIGSSTLGCSLSSNCSSKLFRSLASMPTSNQFKITNYKGLYSFSIVLF